MTKLSTLILAVFAAVAFNAQAASHAGGAPMKASAPMAKASGEMKKEMKKEEKKEMKKEEMKK
jgi:ribosomal protein L12E/L44/L45/RPP1/RPP2